MEASERRRVLGPRWAFGDTANQLCGPGGRRYVRQAPSYWRTAGTAAADVNVESGRAWGHQRFRCLCHIDQLDTETRPDWRRVGPSHREWHVGQSRGRYRPRARPFVIPRLQPDSLTCRHIYPY